MISMIVRCRFAISIAVSLISVSLHAEPPDIVYRVDDRPPEVIFAHGFTAWGGNNNLVAHVTGESCGESVDTDEPPSSAFISTTTSWNAAMNLASLWTITASATGQVRDTYIYRIRADRFFFNALDSIAHYDALHPADTPSLTPEIARALTRAEEWVAWRSIPNSSVSEVWRYRPGTGLANSSQTNPRYLSTNSRANPGPFTQYLAPSHHQFLRLDLGARFGGMISSCFSSCSPRSSEMFGAGGGEPCRAFEPSIALNKLAAILSE